MADRLRIELTGGADRVSREVRCELNEATRRFGPMASPHEGYAVIKEELDELWEEVRGEQDSARMREEALQVAAMAMRFVVDLCPRGQSRRSRDPAASGGADPSGAE